MSGATETSPCPLTVMVCAGAEAFDGAFTARADTPWAKKTPAPARATTAAATARASGRRKPRFIHNSCHTSHEVDRLLRQRTCQGECDRRILARLKAIP